MNKSVLIIGDTHIPYEIKGYLEFCKRIESDLKCTEVVHIGDLVDNHAISYHEHDPDEKSPADEMYLADQRLKKWFKAFPKVKLCLGNHDRLVDRKGKTSGLPQRVFQPFRKIWELPNGWTDDFEFIIGGVKYLHGTGYSGNMAHIQAAYDNRMSCVIGHLHSVSGVEYLANSKDIIFGLSVGCGIDRKARAFEYGREHKRKPILSCGVVEYTPHGINARVFPMELK
jgi:predicted phosphodiesterase